MKAYNESLKILWDNYSIIETAKKEGFDEGFAQGYKEGFAQGYEEEKNKISKVIAKQMKKEGISIPKIIRITGLSQEQIEKL